MVEIKAIDQLIALFARALPRSTSADLLIFILPVKKGICQQTFWLMGLLWMEIEKTGFELCYQSWESRTE